MNPREVTTQKVQLKRVLLVAVVIATLIQTVRFFGYFRQSEWTMARLLLENDRALPSREVYLVAITDEDYRTTFGSRSPLDAEQLLHLLETIERTKPRLFVLDLDVQPSEAEFRSDDRARLNLLRAIERMARDGTTQIVLPAFRPPLFPGGQMEDLSTVWTALTDLAGTPGSPLHFARTRIYPHESRTGRIPLLSKDDGQPTILGQIAISESGSERSAQKELHVRFTGAFHDPEKRRRSGVMFSLRSDSSLVKTIPQRSIVIIGGTYNAGGADEFITPIGRIPGCVLWAEAVDTWVRESRVVPARRSELTTLFIDLFVRHREPTLFGSWLVDVGLGFALGILFIFVSPLLATPFVTAGVVILAVIAFGKSHSGSWILLELVPIVTGISMHHNYEVSKKLRETDRALRELKAAVEARNSGIDPLA